MDYEIVNEALTHYLQCLEAHLDVERNLKVDTSKTELKIQRIKDEFKSH